MQLVCQFSVIAAALSRAFGMHVCSFDRSCGMPFGLVAACTSSMSRCVGNASLAVQLVHFPHLCMCAACCRFDCNPQPVSAAVSVYADGSICVSHGGIEMGQGLSTKVKQAAVFELGQLLPYGMGPLPLSLVRLAPSSTEVVPGGGPTWSSTGSEGCVQAVRLACDKIAARLAPYMQVTAPRLSA